MKLPITSLFLILFGLLSPALAFDSWKVSDPKESVSFEPTKGVWNLVAVWALDCIPCEQQKPALSQFHSRYNELTVTGVSIDGISQLDAIKKRLANKPVAFDNYVANHETFKKQFINNYGKNFLVTPTYVLYSPDGLIAGIQEGPIDFNNLISIIR